MDPRVRARLPNGWRRDGKGGARHQRGHAVVEDGPYSFVATRPAGEGRRAYFTREQNVAGLTHEVIRTWRTLESAVADLTRELGL